MERKRHREGHRGRRPADGRPPQLPWQAIVNPYAPLEVLSADQVEAIHLASLRILEEPGMEVVSARALPPASHARAPCNPSTHRARNRSGANGNSRAHYAYSPVRPCPTIFKDWVSPRGRTGGPPAVNPAARARRPWAATPPAQPRAVASRANRCACRGKSAATPFRARSASTVRVSPSRPVRSSSQSPWHIEAISLAVSRGRRSR
jgi:hypothetical protein